MTEVMLRRLALFGCAKASIKRPGRLPTRIPRVSVVIPCYNYGHFVSTCAQSALTQPGVDVDVLIIDDASTDGSADQVRATAAKDSRVRVICHKQNKGHIATYNEGLFQVEGDYVVLLSADDLLAPGSLLRATALMEENPEVGLTYGPTLVFTQTPLMSDRSDATSWTIWQGHDWLEDRCRTGRNALRSPEAVMRTSVLHEIGGYKASLPHAGDFHVWMKAARISNVGYIGGITQAYYRVHTDNMHNAQFERNAASGILIDLQQRHACFSDVLRDDADVADAETLLHAARSSLAREALTLAMRSYEWGVADEWPVAELIAFAEQICPPSELRAHWRALAFRRKADAARTSWLPLFLPSRQMYKLRCGINEWRWRYAGI